MHTHTNSVFNIKCTTFPNDYFLLWLNWIDKIFTFSEWVGKYFCVVKKSLTIYQRKIAQTTNVPFHIFRLTDCLGIESVTNDYAINRSNWTLCSRRFEHTSKTPQYTPRFQWNPIESICAGVRASACVCVYLLCKRHRNTYSAIFPILIRTHDSDSFVHCVCLFWSFFLTTI